MLNARLRLALPRRRIDGANTTAAYSAEYGFIHPSTGGIECSTKSHVRLLLII